MATATVVGRLSAAITKISRRCVRLFVAQTENGLYISLSSGLFGTPKFRTINSVTDGAVLEALEYFAKESEGLEYPYSLAWCDVSTLATPYEEWQWCWVTDGKRVWPAMNCKTGLGGWVNADFHDEPRNAGIIAWQPMPPEPPLPTKD